MFDWKYWLYRKGIDVDRFSLRDVLNDNPNAVLIGAAAIVLVCVSLVVCHFSGGGAPSGNFKYNVTYYDTTNRVIRIVEIDSNDGMYRSPMDGTTDVFEAIIYSCGEQPKGLLRDGMSLQELEEKGLFIGWLQKTEPVKGGQSSSPDFMEIDSITYRRLDGTRWYKDSSPEMNKIFNAPYEKCKNAQIYVAR